VLNNKLKYLSLPDNLEAIGGIKRGIERETLRFQSTGKLSQSAHPAAFGAALTHPYITTDYSEALLEFITPACESAVETMAQLTDIHSYVVKNLSDEYLWPLSMPCYIGGEDEIPLADYGSSNIGQMKHRYRQGLKYRYGSSMQVIAGIHFNFSFPESLWQTLAQMEGLSTSSQDFQSAQYLNLIRNFKRYVWLPTYLYGASPAMCRSFLGDNVSVYPFESLAEGTVYLPYATSLRLSDLGYTNDAQSALDISYSSLEEYVAGLRKAIKTPAPQYSLVQANAEGYQQLNGNVLQIENEYYSPVRPKRVTRVNEKPTDALATRGIEYVEIRSLDINPFSAVGIELEQMYFLDVLLCWCLLKDSPLLDEAENREVEDNLNKVILQGRDPQLMLSQQGAAVSLNSWGCEIFTELESVAVWLDNAHQSNCYQQVIKQQLAAVTDPELTLSARYLDALKRDNIDASLFGMQRAKANKWQLSQLSASIFSDQAMAEQGILSRVKQREMEQNDSLDFERFLAAYFAE
jgi:glutamate--cysteine ligase